MKKAFAYIILYSFGVMVLSSLISILFVISPHAPTITQYISAGLQFADMFFYGFFLFIPFCAIVMLPIFLLHLLRKSHVDLSDFLFYLFFVLGVWLLLIPFCTAYQPELIIVTKIMKNFKSPAHLFFNNLQTFRSDVGIDTPPQIQQTFFALRNLRNVARDYVESGRFLYLFFAGMALPFSALYAFLRFFRWKLINAACILIGAVFIFVLNSFLYEYSFVISFLGNSTALVLNTVLACMFVIAGFVSFLVRKNRGEV